MNEQAKKLWLAKLRDPANRQGHGQLKGVRQDDETIEGEDPNPVTYCCLGLLCEVHAELTGHGFWHMRNGIGKYVTDMHYDGINRGNMPSSETALPRPVAEWAFPGKPWMDYLDPDVILPGRAVPVILSKVNDGDTEIHALSFAQIADLIEAQL